jgi:hypothetical protein
MVDFLSTPVDICFGLMLAESTAPSACLIIENNVATSFDHVKSDMLTKTHPPSPCDLIVGLHRVKSMLSDMIKVCEGVKHS